MLTDRDTALAWSWFQGLSANAPGMITLREFTSGARMTFECALPPDPGGSWLGVDDVTLADGLWVAQDTSTLTAYRVLDRTLATTGWPTDKGDNQRRGRILRAPACPPR